LLEAAREKRPDLTVLRLDALRTGADELHGGDLPRVDPVADLGGRRMEEVHPFA